uniref:Uncharacterized protein n=1 Tax=Oryza barthii TaxID=65489 RepID=A0A0D3HAH5_9ORYZ
MPHRSGTSVASFSLGLPFGT